MIVTSAGHTVSCVTDNNDGTVTVRLAPTRDADGATTEREVRLAEPSLREYAELRTLIVDTHEGLQRRFPPPPTPSFDTEVAQTPEGMAALAEYQQAVQEWTAARNKAIKAIADEDGKPQMPPYAACMVAIVERLAVPPFKFPETHPPELRGIDDLVPEALQPRTYTGLLEVWDAPLGGPGDLTNNPTLRALAEAATPAPPTAAPASDAQAEPASPEPEESSPPGTEHSPPSPPPPSTP